jgi:hypothetical protein
METQRTGRVKTKYNDFSGGVQVYTSPLWVKDNETPFCKNVDISRPGKLKKALGYTELGTETGTDAPRGSFIFDKEDGTSEVYKLTDDTLKKYSDSSWSTISGGSTIGAGTAHMEGVLMYINTGTGVGTGADSFVERMYFTVGLSDEVKYTNGSTIGQIASTYAKHLEAYKSRLYLGNVKQGSNTYPSRVIYTEISSDTVESTNYIDDFGEPITALKEYSGSLFFFGENKLAAYDEYKLQTIPGNFGTTSSESVQKAMGRMIWYNRSGVYMYAGGTSPQNISKRVQDWIEAISDPDEVTAGIDEEERYNLYIGDVTVDGTAHSDVVLRYDLSLNAWDILPDRPFKYWVRQRSGGVFKIYASDVDNDKVWQVNNGRTLNGDSIVSEWQSAKLDMGQPDTYKNYYEAFVVFKPTGASEHLSLQYRLDGDTSWSNIGDTLNNVSVSGSDDIETKRLVFPKNVQGKMIQFKLGHTSSSNGFDLYELNIKNDELRN